MKTENTWLKCCENYSVVLSNDNGNNLAVQVVAHKKQNVKTEDGEKEVETTHVIWQKLVCTWSRENSELLEGAKFSRMVDEVVKEAKVFIHLLKEGNDLVNGAILRYRSQACV